MKTKRFRDETFQTYANYNNKSDYVISDVNMRSAFFDFFVRDSSKWLLKIALLMVPSLLLLEFVYILTL